MKAPKRDKKITITNIPDDFHEAEYQVFEVIVKRQAVGPIIPGEEYKEIDLPLGEIIDRYNETLVVFKPRPDSGLPEYKYAKLTRSDDEKGDTTVNVMPRPNVPQENRPREI